MSKGNLTVSGSDHEGASERKTSSVFKWLLLLSVLIIVGLVITFVFLHFTVGSFDESEVCMTEECVLASAYILSKMNKSVDPCQDMYTYSCGGWMSKTRRPMDKVKWEAVEEIDAKLTSALLDIVQSDDITYKGRNSSAIDKLKTLFHNCMDEKTINAIGTSRLSKMIDELGSWTVTSNNITKWDADKWSLQTTIEKLHLLGAGPLFAMKVMRDHLNGSNMIIIIAQPEALVHTSQLNNTELTEAFVSYVAELGELLGGEPAETRKKAKEIVDFEWKLQTIKVPSEQLQHPVQRYKKIKVEQLYDYFAPWLDIGQYLRVMFNGVDISNDTDVVFPTANYFTMLKSLIKLTNKEVLANVLVSGFIRTFKTYLPRDFDEAQLELREMLYGVSTLSPRHEICLSIVRGTLGFAISALYVDKYFSKESKAKVSKTISELQEAFLANLDDIHWVDSATRTKLEEKAKAISNFIGYPDWLLDVEKLDKHYEATHVIDGEFFETFINISREIERRDLDSYWNSPSRHRWSKSPDEINAYYSTVDNNIVFLAAILQPPFFIPTFPDSFNYGTIGMVAGHELIHGFDSNGRFYDKDGNLGDIWTRSAAEGFAQGAGCFVEQYSNYTVHGTNLDGNLTLGENMADNGGLKLAYKAYKKAARPMRHALPALDLTDDQLYFIGFSQLWCAHYSQSYEVNSIRSTAHSNSKYRVIGSVSNSKDFAEAFNCPINSAMNPEKKCSVW